MMAFALTVHREWPFLWLRVSMFVRDLLEHPTDAESARVVRAEVYKARAFQDAVRRSGYFN
jgi:hypothetical protein